MSMPALLSQFGIDTQRFVTVDGRAIFDGVSSGSAGSFAHAEHGPVSSMSSHTFHGDGPEPVDAPSDRRWWDDDAKLQRHIDVTAAAFPGFQQYEDDDETNPPAWYGDINTGRGTFLVMVVTRKDEGLPRVRVIRGGKLGVSVNGRWRSSPHLFDNGSLCIADQSDWDPETHTVATAVAWTAHWLAAFTEWRILRRWPVDGFLANAA